VSPMQRGRNQKIGDLVFPGNLCVRMMEKDEYQLNRFHRQNNVSINANRDHKKTLVGDFDHQIDHVESKTGGYIECLVAVMNLVESPKKFIVMTHNMPKVDAQVIDQKRQSPFCRAFFHAMKKPMARKFLSNEKEGGSPDKG